MNQRLVLEVEDVVLLVGPTKTDRLLITVHSPEIVARVVGTMERAREVWNDRMTFSVETTKGCGEIMAKELGLTVTRKISTT